MIIYSHKAIYLTKAFMNTLTDFIISCCRDGASFVDRTLGRLAGRLGERKILPMEDEEILSVALPQITSLPSSPPEICGERVAVFSPDMDVYVETGKITKAITPILSTSTVPADDLLSPVSVSELSSPVDICVAEAGSDARVEPLNIRGKVSAELNALALQHRSQTSPLLYQSLFLKKRRAPLRFLTEVLSRVEEFLKTGDGSQEELRAEWERLSLLQKTAGRVCMRFMPVSMS